jgi:hypothetical protein
VDNRTPSARFGPLFTDENPLKGPSLLALNAIWVYRARLRGTLSLFLLYEKSPVLVALLGAILRAQMGLGDRKGWGERPTRI